MTKKKIFALPELCVFDKDTAQTHYCTVISMQVLTPYRTKLEYFRKRRLNCSSQSMVHKQANANQYFGC